MDKRSFLFRKSGVLFLTLMVVFTFAFSLADSRTPDALDIRYEGKNIKITWAKVEGAESYKIYHGPTRLSAQKLVATVKVAGTKPESGFGQQVVFGYTHKSPNSGKYENHYRIVPLDAQGNTIVSIEWELGRMNNAASYEVQRTEKSDGEYVTIGKIDGSQFTDKVGNFDRYENRYRIIPLNTDGEQITNNRWGQAYVTSGAIILDFEQTISFEKKLFGENMLFYDAKFDDGKSIAKEINRIHDDEMFSSASGPAGGQFSFKRYSLNLKPGKYTDFGDLKIGYYTSFAGLGALPTDTKLYGSMTIPAPLGGGNATCTFWRSVENFELNPLSPSDDTTMFRWAVSQAAPARRLSVNIRTQFDWAGVPGMRTPWASGGFLSDSRFTTQIGSPNQQQWYTRNSHFGHSEFSGDNWNRVTQGVTGHPYTSNWTTGGARTNIEEVPVVREKPFLFLDGGKYKVFVPALRHNSRGITWNDETGDMGKGTILDLEKDFYVAKPGDAATKINAQINAGKHVFFTPGWYDLEVPIRVTRAGTILLGSGYATLFPGENNRDGAILIDDVPGVTVASLMIDAHFNSKYLIRAGEGDANKDHSANPTLLSDVFIRVGGYKTTPVNAEISVQINSNNVIGDHLWIWRADHGNGVSWNTNTGDYGLIVSGNHVTMYGLFVEHYQKYQTLWLGENGKTFFYQNELPYDPPVQSEWISHGGTVNGYAAYKVGNNVNHHDAIGVGCYGVFNRQQQNVYVCLANAVEVPNKSNVTIMHVVTTELGGRGGTTNIVNGTGEGVGRSADGSVITNNATARRLVSYNNGTGIARPASGDTNLVQRGIDPTDEVFDFQK